MSDPRTSSNSSSSLTLLQSSCRGSATVSSSLRSRSRRLASYAERREYGSDHDPTADSVTDISPSNSITDLPELAQPPADHTQDSGAGIIGTILGQSWVQGWSSVQGFASSLLSTGHDNLQKEHRSHQQAPSRNLSRPHVVGQKYLQGKTAAELSSWGPKPPPRKLPGLNDDVAASMNEREAARQAARMASILESHTEVNHGFDLKGKHKRRKSSEAAPTSLSEDCLVYIHYVQPNDTYAGIILRYKCQEDVFRRANGLWTRDSIQTRKWLVIPVDICEIRGRPCEEPLQLDPQVIDSSEPGVNHQNYGGGLSVIPTNGGTFESTNEDKPWTHVRWVQMNSLHHPIQIARVSKQWLGFFPPRRRMSTASNSSPRQSSDCSAGQAGSAANWSSCRQNYLESNQRPCGSSLSSRSRRCSEADDSRPAWMRRPGGVGSIIGNSRSPGPGGDYLNLWTRKHLPALNIESFPSMSVMGSESARFGFTSEPSDIAESTIEIGHDDLRSASRQGSGLDRAAAAVESWLRGAWARQPGSQVMGGRGRPTTLSNRQNDWDLIELTDTASEDGRLSKHGASITTAGVPPSL